LGSEEGKGYIVDSIMGGTREFKRDKERGRNHSRRVSESGKSWYTLSHSRMKGRRRTDIGNGDRKRSFGGTREPFPAVPSLQSYKLFISLVHPEN
jgi:hypothetical protein